MGTRTITPGVSPSCAVCGAGRARLRILWSRMISSHSVLAIEGSCHGCYARRSVGCMPKGFEDVQS
ncbi:hypothetical protein E4T39_04299 [Aureobasidium subglaciale]|nr:hypothetical protein E4T39_04299 [Aureobasidium subglaciale]